MSFKKIILLLIAVSACHTLQAQSKLNDIPASQLPGEVRLVLNEYIAILTNASDLNACANVFAKIASGSLVNEDGNTLRESVKPYSLKKDFSNIRFYASPIQITRVNKSRSNGSGFGPSAIRGDVYKIWIGKKEGQPGMPAPISIMVPEGHPNIKSPKIVGIGSL